MGYLEKLYFNTRNVVFHVFQAILYGFIAGVNRAMNDFFHVKLKSDSRRVDFSVFYIKYIII